MVAASCGGMLLHAWRGLSSTWHRHHAAATRHYGSSTATPSSSSISAALQRAITPAVCTALIEQGYAVVDNLFEPQHTGALRAEIVRLFEKEGVHRRVGRPGKQWFELAQENLGPSQTQLMHKNHTHLVRDNKTTLLEKSHIHEAELTLDSHTQAEAPLCTGLHRDSTLRTMVSLFTPSVTLDMQAIKLQYNAGHGGCFPIHMDTDAALDGRRVTSIFYLNPMWKPCHGGMLKLYPWPRPAVEIAPLDNRLVLFSSHRMLHRVTPSTAPPTAARCCFTIWLSQSRGRQALRAPPAPLSSIAPKAAKPEDDMAASLAFMLSPNVRQHAAKLALADEWEQSLKESHREGPGLDTVLERHRADVELIKRALGKFSGIIDRLQHEPQLAEAATSKFVTWL